MGLPVKTMTSATWLMLPTALSARWFGNTVMLAALNRRKGWHRTDSNATPFVGHDLKAGVGGGESPRTQCTRGPWHNKDGHADSVGLLHFRPESFSQVVQFHSDWCTQDSFLASHLYPSQAETLLWLKVAMLTTQTGPFISVNVWYFVCGWPPSFRSNLLLPTLQRVARFDRWNSEFQYQNQQARKSEQEPNLMNECRAQNRRWGSTLNHRISTLSTPERITPANSLQIGCEFLCVVEMRIRSKEI